MAQPNDALDDDLSDVPLRRSWRERLRGLFVRGAAAGGRRRIWAWAAAGLLGLLLLYFIGGAFWVSRIDDDPNFAPAAPTAGGSRAIDMAAALIAREVDDHAWTANDPFFLPGWLLDNMPNYQQGIIYALSRFTGEMSDQIGRARGSSQVDPDLDRAAGLLRYPGTIWVFNLANSLAPTASAESQYRAARRALLDYNRRLAAGEAVFERRADNLLRTLDRIAADLGSSSAAIAEHLEDQSGWPIDLTADDLFYATKGRLYGYFMILRALGEDFAPVLSAAGAGTVWADMLASLRAAAELQPIVVISGAPDSTVLPSHLASQGFYLLRARTQLRELTSVLVN